MEEGTIRTLIAKRHGVDTGTVSIDVVNHSKVAGIRSFKANTPRGFFLYHVLEDGTLSLEMFSRLSSVIEDGPVNGGGWI